MNYIPIVGTTDIDNNVPNRDDPWLVPETTDAIAVKVKITNTIYTDKEIFYHRLPSILQVVTGVEDGDDTNAEIEYSFCGRKIICQKKDHPKIQNQHGDHYVVSKSREVIVHGLIFTPPNFNIYRKQNETGIICFHHNLVQYCGNHHRWAIDPEEKIEMMRRREIPDDLQNKCLCSRYMFSETFDRYVH